MFFLRKRSDYCIIPSFAIFAEGKNDKAGGTTVITMKKIRIPSEAAYLFALVLMALSVAMTASADFGVSMIVAPAYILSLKFSFLTFGQSEYIVQALLFIVFCILVKKVRLMYFVSFLTALIYGGVLDLWRSIIPILNPSVTAPGSMELWLRITLFTAGMVMTAFTVALFFRSYIYPQVYDFFVKGISAHFGLNMDRFKIIFDFSCLAVACAMTLLFFGRFNGVGIGTVIMTCINGLLIGMFGKLIDRCFIFVPLFPKLEEKMRL